MILVRILLYEDWTTFSEPINLSKLFSSLTHNNYLFAGKVIIMLMHFSSMFSKHSRLTAKTEREEKQSLIGLVPPGIDKNSEK